MRSTTGAVRSSANPARAACAKSRAAFAALSAAASASSTLAPRAMACARVRSKISCCASEKSRDRFCNSWRAACAAPLKTREITPSPLSTERTNASHAAPSLSKSPDTLLSCSAAVRRANPESFTASVYFSMPSRPSSYRMLATRSASCPKIMASVCVRCASVTPAKPWRRLPAISARDRNSPFELVTSMPYFCMASRACFVGFSKRTKALRREVPASLPISPALANAVNPPIVSSIERPKPLATRPACAIACAISPTPPCAMFAPFASRSDTCAASSPSRLNCARAEAMYSALSPTAIPPAAERANAADRPPPRIVAVSRPAFASSVNPSAASFGVRPRLGPMRISDSAMVSACAANSSPSARIPAIA